MNPCIQRCSSVVNANRRNQGKAGSEASQPSFKEKPLFFEQANFPKTDPHLISVHVAETILDVGVDYQFSESQDLPTEMESIPKTRFLSLLGGERLDGLQVEVVVKVEVV